MCAFWDTAEAKEKSLTTSAARMSDRKGLGPHKHNSGQKSFQQIEQEMVTSFSLTKLKKNYVLIPFTLFTISGRGIGQTGDS